MLFLQYEFETGHISNEDDDNEDVSENKLRLLRKDHLQYQGVNTELKTAITNISYDMWVFV